MRNQSIKTLEDLYAFSLEKYFGKYYQWGGDLRGYGIDCSGLVQLILEQVDLDPKGDQTADSLYLHFKKNGLPGIKGRGALAFFGTAERISHVGWMIDKHSMLNAAGGGSHVKNLTTARQLHASVKIQPLSWYKTPALIDTIMPSYESVGISYV